jgi:hypothetical protein
MIDEKTIREWAEHECDTHHGGPCIGNVQWHTERRELAQAVLVGADAAMVQLKRAEDAIAARDALAGALLTLISQTPYGELREAARRVLHQHVPDWREK